MTDPVAPKSSELIQTKLIRINSKDYLQPGVTKEIVEAGQNLLEQNMFFKDLAELMEIPKFQKFLNKYFYNSLEIQNSTMYIKLYELLQKSIQLNENSGVTIEDSKYVTIYFLYNMMNMSDFRSKIVNITSTFLDCDNDTIYSNKQLYGALRSLGEAEKSPEAISVTIEDTTKTTIMENTNSKNKKKKFKKMCKQLEKELKMMEINKIKIKP
jgi:hypothetical protein